MDLYDNIIEHCQCTIQNIGQQNSQTYQTLMKAEHKSPNPRLRNQKSDDMSTFMLDDFWNAMLDDMLTYMLNELFYFMLGWHLTYMLNKWLYFMLGWHINFYVEYIFFFMLGWHVNLYVGWHVKFMWIIFFYVMLDDLLNLYTYDFQLCRFFSVVTRTLTNLFGCRLLDKNVLQLNQVALFYMIMMIWWVQ